MRPVADNLTSPTLLREVSDWRDHPSWVVFRDRYDPLLRRWCLGYGLDDDSADEVRQRIWVELANRMRTFEYDPKRTFRGWLRRVCESRIVDFLRQRKAAGLVGLDDRDGEPEAAARRDSIELVEGDPGGRADGSFRLFLLDEAEKAQETVRAKVKPWTWEAFWLVAVCDWTVARTAESLGMTHASVYAASERVARMLRDEGTRVRDGWEAGP